VEYDNAVRDLLGDDTRPATRLLSTTSAQISLRPADAFLVEEYVRVAEDVAQRAAVDVEAATGCNLAEDDFSCMREFISRFGRRAYRQPLDASDVNRLFLRWAEWQGDWGHNKSLEMLLANMLQSPEFLYRLEAMPADPGDEPVALSDYELASRLSFFLWQSVPDEDLLAAAERGELHTREQVAAHARRMLDDPRSDALLLQFHDEWLGLPLLEGLVKDSALFPEFSPEISAKLREQAHRFVLDVFRNGDARFETLITSDDAFFDAELAALYGVEGDFDSSWTKVPRGAAFEGGALAQGGFLAVHARGDGTSPIRRGIFVRSKLLCGSVPDVPPGVNRDIKPPMVGQTTRSKFEAHAVDPACAVCHASFDDLGFAFEHFDSLGRWRDSEGTAAIDTTGELSETDVDASFDGAADMLKLVASSEDAEACLARRWFRFAYDRREQGEADECAIEELYDAVDRADGDMRELIIAVTASNAFLYRQHEAVQETVSP
jgi:hypothetical protein